MVISECQWFGVATENCVERFIFERFAKHPTLRKLYTYHPLEIETFLTVLAKTFLSGSMTVTRWTLSCPIQPPIWLLPRPFKPATANSHSIVGAEDVPRGFGSGDHEGCANGSRALQKITTCGS